MPIQLSGSLVITGSITTTGVITMSGSIASASYSSNSDLLQGTGSVGFATTASLLAVSSSQQQISSSLLQVSASYISLSGSYNTFSGSASTRITANSSSIQQISSSQQQISSSLLNVVANYATTGSNSFRANQSITGSLVVSSTITAQTLVVQTVTSSIVYSSGSNLFGSALGDRQTFTGSVNITGSQTVFGNVGIGVVAGTNGAKLISAGGATSFFDAAGSRGISIYPSSAGNIHQITSDYIATSYYSIAITARGNNNDLFISSSGNVGISTVTPTNGKLEIQTTNTNAGLWVQTGGTTSGYTIADFRTGTNASALQILGNSNSIFGGATSFLNNLCLNGDFTVRGRTTTWGTISLIPDNPGGCNGSSGNTVLLGTIVACSGYGPQLRFSGATSGEFIDIGQTSTGGFVVEGTDNPRLIITNCGSVGIGCVSPLHNLDIGSVRTNIGGFAFCNMVTAQSVFSTFACVGSDANVVTTITYTNTGDHNRSGVFIARWAYNTACAALHIVSCLWNDSQNIGSFGLRNNGGALQICVSGGGGDYRVQALTQGTKAT